MKFRVKISAVHDVIMSRDLPGPQRIELHRLALIDPFFPHFPHVHWPMRSNHLCPLNCLFGDSCFSLNKLSPPPHLGFRGVRLDDIINAGYDSTDHSLLMRQGFGNSGRFSQPSFSQTNNASTPSLFTKPTKCQHEQPQCSSPSFHPTL